MNFKLTHPLPERCLVAVSGGVDSMAALHFLSQVEGRVKAVVHVHHGTGEFADRASERVTELVPEVGVTTLLQNQITVSRPEGESWESFWRTERYEFFESWAEEWGLPVVLAHNLDDCLENYIQSTMIAGHLGTIPYAHGPCIRPFRLWKRSAIEVYARDHKISWVEDPSNRDYVNFQRAFIRMHIVPRIRHMNPGIYKVAEKAVHDQDAFDKAHAPSSIGLEQRAHNA